MSRCFAGWLWGVVAFVGLLVTIAEAQPPAAETQAEEGAEAEPNVPQIADEPKTLDLAASMPESGDPQFLGEGLGGMGGFGGGFFSVLPESRRTAD